MKRISEHQWGIYQEWLKRDCQFKPTAKVLGKTPEIIRRTVAKVLRKLKDGEKPPHQNYEFPNTNDA
jgi:hypothetical protein